MVYWLKRGNVSKQKARLQREIFDPAVRLHQEIRCSTQQYEFIGTARDFWSEPSSGGEEVFPYNAKDITTWKTVAGDSTDLYRRCIYPGLAAYDAEVEKKSELVKPVIVVYKQIPSLLPKRLTTSSANSSPQRKELRDHKQQKPTTGPMKNFIRFLEPPTRRQSRHTTSTHSRNNSPSRDQSLNHAQPNPTPQNSQSQASSSTNTQLPAGGSQYYGDEMMEEPEEMEYWPNDAEFPIDAYYDRPDVSDEM